MKDVPHHAQTSPPAARCAALAVSCALALLGAPGSRTAVAGAPPPPARIAWRGLPLPRTLGGTPLEPTYRIVRTATGLVAAGGGCGLDVSASPPALRCAGALAVVDARDPARPAVGGALHTGSDALEIAALAAAGGTAYVVLREHGADVGDVALRLWVVDLGAPGVPAVVRDLALPGRGADDVAVAAGAGFAYVASGGGWTAYDLTEPGAPVQEARHDDGARAVALDGATLYAATDEGLLVYDVSDPIAARRVAGVPAGIGSRWLRVADRLALVRRDALCPRPGGGGRDVRCGDLLEAIDVTDPRAAAPIGPTWGGRGVDIAAAAATESRLVVASSRLVVLDRADPDLRELATYTSRPPAGAGAPAATIADVRPLGPHAALLVHTDAEVALDVVSLTAPAPIHLPVALSAR